MRTKIAAALLVLTTLALAGQVAYDLKFRNHNKTMVIPASAACTTQWQYCQNGRSQALGWQLWVKPGAVDSARVKIDRQSAAKDTTTPVSALDTLISVSVCNVLDTTGAPRILNRQFWPIPCLWERFIVTGIASNSDSSVVGNIVHTQDDGK